MAWSQPPSGAQPGTGDPTPAAPPSSPTEAAVLGLLHGCTEVSGLSLGSSHQKQVTGSPGSTHGDSKTCSHNATESSKTGLSQPATHMQDSWGLKKAAGGLSAAPRGSASDQVAFEKKGYTEPNMTQSKPQFQLRKVRTLCRWRVGGEEEGETKEEKN